MSYNEKITINARPQSANNTATLTTPGAKETVSTRVKPLVSNSVAGNPIRTMSLHASG